MENEAEVEEAEKLLDGRDSSPAALEFDEPKRPVEDSQQTSRSSNFARPEIEGEKRTPPVVF